MLYGSIVYFQKLDSPPHPASMIDFPEKKAEQYVVAPSLQLFNDELLFWREEFNRADRAGDATSRRMAEIFNSELYNAALGRVGLEQMSQAERAIERDALGEWYIQSTTSMAFSRMWRELSAYTESRGETFSLTFTDIGACIDFDPSDPHRSGIHVMESGTDILGVEWPEQPHQPVWYEGESIYLRVKRPANATARLRADFQNFYNLPFVPERFITAIPRIKSSVWS